MTTFETLTVDAAPPVGRLTLRRPAVRNALSRRTLQELVAAAAWFDERRDVKVVVVEGEGVSFCGGFDLHDFAAEPAPGELPREAADDGRRMADAVTGMRAVTVARIQGHCVGGGVVLASSCDLRVAAAGTLFSIPEVDLGIPLAWGGLPRLVREIGPAMTKELVMTCRPFDADEAQRLGFVNRVVPAESLDAEVDGLASELASKSSLTLQVTKRHVNALTEETASTAMSFADADVLAAALRDPESRAVGQAYLQRRARR